MAKALGALHRKLKLAPFLPLRKGKKTEERARSVADVIANKMLNGRNYACKRIVLSEEFEDVFSKKTRGLITFVPPGDGALMDNDRNTAMCHFMALRAGSAVRAVLTFPGEKEGAAKETPRRSPRKQTAAATDPDGVDLDIEGLADLDGVELEAGSDKKGAPELPQKPLGRHSAGIRIRWIVSGFRCLHAPPGRVLSWPCTLCISRMQTRFRLVHEAADGNEAVYEPYVVKTKRGEASWVASFKMEVASDIIRGHRPHTRELKERGEKQKAKKRQKDQQRDSVKSDTMAEVDRRVKSRSTAVAP